jgi:hypothetical protein
LAGNFCATSVQNLSAAGAVVFRDAGDIGAGADREMTIEEALRECHCVASLLFGYLFSTRSHTSSMVSPLVTVPL